MVIDVWMCVAGLLRGCFGVVFFCREMGGLLDDKNREKERGYCVEMCSIIIIIIILSIM